MDRLAERFVRYRAHGDIEALGEVFDATAPRLLALALHLCGDPVDAEDALQQTFLRAMGSADAFDATRALEPWLAGLLANAVRSGRRRAGVRRAEPLPELASGDEGPVAAAERGELVAHLRTHVESLPQEQRQVLLLQLQHGLAPAEIAEVLEVPPGTVRMRLHRGLQALRKLLPAGLAAWLFGALPARGLAAVRQSVMEAAGKEAVVVGAGASAAAAVAGVLAMKKVIALMVAGLLVGILLWVASGPAASPVLRSLADGATRPVAAALADRAGAPSGSDSPPVNRIAVTDPPGSLRVRASFLMQTRAGPPPAVGLAINHCPADCALEVWPGDRASPTFGTSSFARTDAGGEVVFAGLAPGIWQVRSVAGMRNPRPAVVASARETSVSVGLIGDGVVRGRVVDVDGRPVTGADVLLFTQAGDESLLMSNRGDRSRAPDLHLRRAVASDAEGRFAIPFAEGEFIVAAAKAGHAPSFAQLTRWLGVAELTLTLGREIGSVEGTVLDRLGAAVPHALVEVRERRPEVHRTADGTLLLRPLPQFARTDERGRFRVDRLSPGRYRLLAVASSHMPGYSELEVGADGHASVDLRLDAAIAVVGSVCSVDGRPLVGLRVRATSDRNSPGAMSAGTTQGDGSFALDHVPAGTFVVLIERGATVLADRTLSSPPPGVLRCDFELPSPGCLRGRILDERGSGLANWMVEAVDAAGHPCGNQVGTDDAGAFVLERPWPGDCRVRAMVRDGDWSEPDVEVQVDAAQTEVLLQVADARLGSVIGRLRDGRGAELADAEVFLSRRGRDNQRSPLRASAAGAFAFAAVPPGEFAVHVEVRGVGYRHFPVTVGRGQRVDLGELVVLPPARLRIEFTRADGTPWQGVLPEVWLRDPLGGLQPEARLDALQVVGSGLEGQLDPGRLRIGLDAFDVFAADQEVELQAGERTVVRFAVAVGRSREIAFRGDEGQPIDASVIHVEVRDEGGREIVQQSFRRSPHGDGHWTLYHTFAFGRYEVEAHTDSGRRYRASFEVRDNLDDPTRIDVPRLER